jgi:hypothetical protein
MHRPRSTGERPMRNTAMWMVVIAALVAVWLQTML